jgi:hypothetical protein
MFLLSFVQRGVGRRCSSLSRVIRRAVRPGCQSRSTGATSQHSPVLMPVKMANRTTNIDMVPFVPSLSPTCRLIDTALVFSVVLAALVAGVLSLLPVLGG